MGSSVAMACAAFSAAIAVVVLCGWLFNVTLLITLLPGRPAMAVPTAIGFLLTSVALALQCVSTKRYDAKIVRPRRLTSLVALMFAIATLLYYFLPNAYLSAPTRIATPSGKADLVNRTSPNTAVNLIFLGISLCLIDVPWRRRFKGDADSHSGTYVGDPARWPFQILALTVILNAFFALLGQVYGITLLYGLSHTFGMAIPTAVVFMILSFGVLASRPDRGFVMILCSDNVAGEAARRLLPLVLAVPLVLGGIAIVGFRFAASFSMYLLIVAGTLMLVSLFWSTILTLHQQVEQAVSYVQQISDQAIAIERQAVEIERADLLVQQRRFVRELLASVTEGKLQLCDDESDMPDLMTTASGIIELTPPTLRLMRKSAEDAARRMNIDDLRIQDLITAVGEAAMNAVRHGGGGTGGVWLDTARGVVQVRIQDSGAGIRDEDLHRATLEKGWSSSGTFGHGFYLMLRTADRTYLLTSRHGTTVVLEQDVVPAFPV